MPHFTASALRADANRFTPLTPQQRAGLSRIIGSGGGGGGGGGAPAPAVYAGPVYAAGPSDTGGDNSGLPTRRGALLVAGGVAALAIAALVIRKVLRKKRR